MADPAHAPPAGLPSARGAARDSAWIHALGVAGIVVAACTALAFASRWGIGISPDSVSYLRGADRLLEGRGLFSLNLHWPPGYPALLAAARPLGPDPLTATRVLHVALFGANLLLFAVALAPRSDAARVAALLGLAFVASATLETHFMAWSEIPFVALQLGATLVLVRHLRGHGPSGLWISAGLGAAAVLVRFAGFPFAAVGALFVLAFSEGTARTRWLRAAAWGLVVCGPAGAWMLGNRLVHGQALDREALAPAALLERLGPALPGLEGWLAPGHPWLSAALAVACGALLARWLQLDGARRPASRNGLLVAFGLAYVVAYLAFVLAYMAFLDLYITLNARLLFPAQAFFTMALLAAAVGLAERPAPVLRAASVCALVAALTAANVSTTQATLRELAADGRGQLDRASRSLPIWDRIRSLPRERIYTNGPDFAYLYLQDLQRPARMLPRHSRPEARAPNDDYREQMADVVAEVQRGDAMVVLFRRFLWRGYLPGPREVEGDFGLRAVYRGPDGIVYAAGPGPPAKAEP